MARPEGHFEVAHLRVCGHVFEVASLVTVVLLADVARKALLSMFDLALSDEDVERPTAREDLPEILVQVGDVPHLLLERLQLLPADGTGRVGQLGKDPVVQLQRQKKIEKEHTNDKNVILDNTERSLMIVLCCLTVAM